MKYSYENQGAATFLACELEEGEQIDNHGMGMLSNGQLNEVLQVAFVQVDERRYLRFNVSSKVQLKDLLRGKMNRSKLLNVLEGVCEAYLGIDQCFLDSKLLITDTNYVFCDVSSGKTSMIYMPVIMENKEEKAGFSSFVKNIIFSTRFAQEDNTDYIPKLMNYVNGDEELQPKAFLEFIRSLHNLPQNKNGGDYIDVSNNRAPGGNATFVGNESPGTNNASQSTQPYSPDRDNYQNNQNRYQKQNDYQNQNKYSTYNQSGNSGNMGGYQNSNTGFVGTQGMMQPQMYPGHYPANPQNVVYGMGNQSNFRMPMGNQGGNDTGANVGQMQKDEKKTKKRGHGFFGLFGKKEEEEVRTNQNVGFNVPQAPQSVSFIGPNSSENGFVNIPRSNQGHGINSNGYGVPNPNNIPYRQYNGNKNYGVGQSYNPPYQDRSQSVPGGQYGETRQDVRNQQPDYVAIASAGGGTTLLTGGKTSEETTLLNPEMLEGKGFVPKATLCRKRTGQLVTIDKDVFRIGKDNSYVDYFIPDNTTISRSHAEIINRDGKYYVRDTNSKNHTYLNGEMLTSNSEYELRSGDLLRLSDEFFEFCFR